MKFIRIIVAATGLAAHVMPATSAPALPVVTNVRGLLLSAIDNPSGKADAWLSGPMAEKLRAETKAPAGTKVKASVSTVSVFREGCKRLRLSLAMPTHRMLTVNGTREPFQMAYELNLCRDGQPPQASSVGLKEGQ